MKVADVPRLRLVAQRLVGAGGSVAETVAHLGALQAQDHGQSLWAVGSRVRGGTLAGVEAALADGSIVRSWPMRGTIHVMAAADVAMWLAIMTRLGTRDGSVTAGMTSAFLGTARRESFRCTARVVKLGRRLVYGVAESATEGGRLLTHHSLTYARASGEKGRV